MIPPPPKPVAAPHAAIKIKRGASTYYPAIPQPYANSPQSTVEVLTALKRAVETLAGASGPEEAHAVTFQTVGAAVVHAVVTGQLSPHVLPLVNPVIVNPGVPPAVIPPPPIVLASDDVLARISIEVVR